MHPASRKFEASAGAGAIGSHVLKETLKVLHFPCGVGRPAKKARDGFPPPIPFAPDARRSYQRLPLVAIAQAEPAGKSYPGL